MLNLRFVETLREVGARGSFSAAANALNFTQPAVSRQVALLEAEAGLPLVQRTRRGVHLTPAGRLVIEHAEAIRGRLRTLETELAEMAGGGRLALALGGFPTAFVGLIPEILRRAREPAPDATIALRRCGHDHATALVRRAELDLALVFARPDAPPPPSDVQVVHIADEPMLAQLPRAHRLADAATVALDDLRDEPWIVGAPDRASSITVAACRDAGFEPRIVHESDDALAVQGLIAAGIGVSLTTAWVRTALRDDVVLRPLAPPAPVRRVAAVVAKRPGPGARLLLRLARDAAAFE